MRLNPSVLQMALHKANSFARDEKSHKIQPMDRRFLNRCNFSLWQYQIDLVISEHVTRANSDTPRNFEIFVGQFDHCPTACIHLGIFHEVKH